VVNVSIKDQFDKWVKEQTDDDKSRLNTHIKTLVEEEIGDLVQTVIDDDMLYIERQLEGVESELKENREGITQTIWRARRADLQQAERGAEGNESTDSDEP
jgi:hypothetical protein